MLFHAVSEPTGWHTMRAPFASNKTTDQTHRSREKKEGDKKILMHHTSQLYATLESHESSLLSK